MLITEQYTGLLLTHLFPLITIHFNPQLSIEFSPQTEGSYSQGWMVQDVTDLRVEPSKINVYAKVRMMQTILLKSFKHLFEDIRLKS